MLPTLNEFRPTTINLTVLVTPQKFVRHVCVHVYTYVYKENDSIRTQKMTLITIYSTIKYNKGVNMLNVDGIVFVFQITKFKRVTVKT